VLLPDPVWPTTASVVPAGMRRSMAFSAGRRGHVVEHRQAPIDARHDGDGQDESQPGFEPVHHAAFSGALFVEQHREEVVAGHRIRANGIPILKSRASGVQSRLYVCHSPLLVVVIVRGVALFL
jgi:hypothetical protein